MYVGGLPCVQVRDVLYSQQADPNDPQLAAPATGVRTDTGYLDVWTDAVTYVEDPEIRELALGGPDTSTRLKIRQRVRVNQGGGMPTGDGRGLGTLATSGPYTGTANRLYLVEIDGAGDIGSATFRWSEDNASTIARVIAAIRRLDQRGGRGRPSSTPARRSDPEGVRQENHVIATVFGNVTVSSPRPRR
jgi:hypothetical protein